MEPISVATGIVTLLAPYVNKAIEEFAGEAGKIIMNKTQMLFEKLRNKFRGDQDMEPAIHKFEKNPDSNSKELTQQLTEKLQVDSTLCDELSAVLEEIKSAGPNIRIVQKVIKAQKMVGIKAKNVKKGNINIYQDADKVKNITGGEFTGDIG